MKAAKLFAMDTWFVSSTGYYPLETRAAMLKEIGFDGMYFVNGLSPLHKQREIEEFARLESVARSTGIEVAGIFCNYDISLPPTDPANKRSLQIASEMRGVQTLDLALTAFGCKWEKGDASHDLEAMRALEPFLDLAERLDFTIALYPHIFFWLEKADDALRLCHAVSHSRLKLNFCGMHWYAVDSTPVFPLLDRLMPYLHGVNLNGSRKPDPGGLPCTVEPLGDGEVDNFAILWKLRQLGFSGWHGLQGYSVGGDIYGKLTRSLETFRAFEDRIQNHPEWSFSMNPELSSTNP